VWKSTLGSEMQVGCEDTHSVSDPLRDAANRGFQAEKLIQDRTHVDVY
jgi:hypothetical protein